MRIARWLMLACVLQSQLSWAGEAAEANPVLLSRPTAAAELKVEILSPPPGHFLAGDNRSIVVDGGASSFGGIRQLDLMFVLDTSKSLKRTDPENFLARGAIGLIRNLSPKSDIQIGVVGFDNNADLLQPLTTDREQAIEALAKLDRVGGTDIADGIEEALAELAANARPDSTRVIMLFTDGRSNARKAQRATEEARAAGIAVHTLQLGEDDKGAEILESIASGTQGSFVQVTDPAGLPQAFQDLRTTGVESVVLKINDGAPIATRLAGGSFSAPVTLEPGENRITAIATGLHGDVASTEIMVTSGPPNCAALELEAFRNGMPAVSIDDRAVEIVVDASRSMWGRMEGEPKMAVAKQTLLDMSREFRGDSHLALRAYGSASASELKDCSDSELLVAFSRDNREQIDRAIETLRPLGQTPLAYALQQAGRDFEGIEGEKAVVLVTDGIESCGGDPAVEAAALRQQGIAIHVIGFGLGNAKAEDTASLDAIAQASGGRFFLAGSSRELKEALAGSVGTAYRIYDGIRVVASGVLGNSEPIMLPEGQYVVELESVPAREIPISLVPGERVKLTLEKTSGSVAQREQRNDVGYMPCPTGAEGLMSAQNASAVSAAPSRSLRETVPREW